jgi:hypothetical protein
MTQKATIKNLSERSVTFVSDESRDAEHSSGPKARTPIGPPGIGTDDRRRGSVAPTNGHQMKAAKPHARRPNVPNLVTQQCVLSNEN